MKIRKMTATFGCLDGQTLELTDGCNCLVIPNEGGKSTWAAFITAMFYGLDPRRAAKSRLSDKERYAPWSGKPMEGTLELVMEGRTIVLQRTSLRGKPFGVFKAWDAGTGLAIASLTAENCGRELLGVEREVFRRSAFLSGTELAVSPDQDLSRRLGALAASGRETDSFLQADSRLRSWQNHLRYHQSGEIPKLQRQLEAFKKETAPEETAHLPTEESLWRLLGKLEETGEEEPVCPAALAGVAEDAIMAKTQRDLAVFRWSAVLLAIACLGFAVAGVLVTPWLLLPGAVTFGVLLWHLCSKRLARRYGVARRREILPAAAQWMQGEKRRWEQSVLLEEIRDFAPEADTVHEARQAVEQALSLHRQAAQSRHGETDAAALQKNLGELLRREQAIVLARQALAVAEEQLQKTYVPYLTRLAGSYLEKLTCGRYDGLVMDASMELSVRQSDGLLRPLAALSRGTQDQTWLALRLAMTNLLLPEGAPVVLDDALLTFDKEREKAAMAVLEQEARQVILFSCR